MAVTLETAPSTAQRCYALERGAGNDPNTLTTAPTVSFFEKTCIPGKCFAALLLPVNHYLRCLESFEKTCILGECFAVLLLSENLSLR